MRNKIYKLLSIFICLSFVVLLIEDVFFKNYFDFKESIITVWKILFMIYLIWTAVVLKNKKGSWF
tara:strand:+ start:382 stop:576 length:195 start_codon:yes stop_codon:yes gene_type:complete